MALSPEIMDLINPSGAVKRLADLYGYELLPEIGELPRVLSENAQIEEPTDTRQEEPLVAQSSPQLIIPNLNS